MKMIQIKGMERVYSVESSRIYDLTESSFGLTKNTVFIKDLKTPRTCRRFFFQYFTCFDVDKLKSSVVFMGTDGAVSVYVHIGDSCTALGAPQLFACADIEAIKAGFPCLGKYLSAIGSDGNTHLTNIKSIEIFTLPCSFASVAEMNIDYAHMCVIKVASSGIKCNILYDRMVYIGY